MAGPYDYTVNIPQPPAQNFLQSLMGIMQIRQMQDQAEIAAQQAKFQKEMQPLEMERLKESIAAQRASQAQSATARDVALEGLRQSKITFGREEELNKQADVLRAEMMKLSADPTSATREKLLDLSYRAAAFAPKSYEPLQKMLKDYPRTGKILENTASDVIFSVQSGQPAVAVKSVELALKGAQNTLEANPDDKDAQAALTLLQPVKSLMDEEKYGEAMITASNFLRNTYPERWDAVTKDMKEAGAGAKAMVEAAGEKTKSELQEAQARLAKADAALKELKATGALDSEEKMKQENLMRENFQAQPLVRNFLIRQDNYDIIRKADNSPEGDRARITAFIKLHDPNSVVSVTEGNQISSNTPVAQYQSLIARFNNDGILGDPARKSINSQAEKTFKSAESQFNTFKNNTGAIAKRYGINPKNVVEVFDRPQTEQPTPPTPTGSPQLPISTGNIPVAPAGVNPVEIEMRRRGLIK